MSSDLKYVYITLVPPSDRNNQLGSIAEGEWKIENGTLRLFDMGGKLIDKSKLLEGEDPAAVARRLLRKSKLGARREVHRGPIRYPDLPVV